MWGKEIKRVVSPKVCQALIDQGAIIEMKMHRQYLQRGDTQIQEMIDNCFGGQTCVGAPAIIRDIGMLHRGAADVRFVNQRLMPRRPRWPIVAPGECRVQHRAQRTKCGAVALVKRQIITTGGISKQRIVPLPHAANCFGVRVQHNFIVIEAMTIVGFVGPVQSVAVELARFCIGEVAVPDHIGAFRQYDTRGFGRVIVRIKQAEIYLGSMLGKDRKIHSRAIPRCT